ncbi:MAG: hypothetical protein KIT89_11095 [Microcella sp.]|uniref:hypothetical protein n=1 Tax=Microcella sp. TaxID=1913979 RepID=UPI0024CA897B|nr:hypothetical protein [Microcella sp.]UYN83233.1 MAG: hypothetical protein KIT89_11095 [Microcella sp.]
MMADAQNRKRSREYRERIALALRAEGIETAQPVPLANRMSDAFRPPHGHVVGVEGVSILTSTSYEIRPGELLDRAERAAQDDQNPLGVAVQFRAARPAEDQFAIMSLRTLATLLRDRLEARS